MNDLYNLHRLVTDDERTAPNDHKGYHAQVRLTPQGALVMGAWIHLLKLDNADEKALALAEAHREAK